MTLVSRRSVYNPIAAKPGLPSTKGGSLAIVAGQALLQHDMQSFERGLREQVERHKSLKVEPTGARISRV